MISKIKQIKTERCYHEHSRHKY